MFGFVAVPVFFQPLVQIPAFGRVFLPAGLTTELEAAFPGTVAVMGEPKEVERVRAAILPDSVFSFETSEAHSPAFLRMDFQRVAPEALFEYSLNAFRVLLVLHDTDEIVCIAHQFAKPVHMFLDRFLEPPIQHVMQIDVGEDRAED